MGTVLVELKIYKNCIDEVEKPLCICYNPLLIFSRGKFSQLYLLKLLPNSQENEYSPGTKKPGHFIQELI